MAAEHTELFLTAADGTALFAQRWTPCATETRAELLIVPGYAEHGGRYRELAHALGEVCVATTAVDLRGHGRSSGHRGHVAAFAEYLTDIDAAFATLRRPVRFVLGHSLGGLCALDWVAARQPQLAGLVLTNPFLELAIPVPRAKLGLARLLSRLWPTLSLPTDLEPAALSHDQAVVEAYRRDPLVFRTANARWFTETLAAQGRVRALTRCDVPLLFVYSDGDRVTSPAASASLAAALDCPDKTVWTRGNELHEVLNETGRAALHRELAAWLAARIGA